MPPPARKEGSLPVKQDAIETVFDIGKELGTGHFSVVKLATHKEQGKEFALKIIGAVACLFASPRSFFFFFFFFFDRSFLCFLFSLCLDIGSRFAIVV
jgi:serine/threonine protein kinase